MIFIKKYYTAKILDKFIYEYSSIIRRFREPFACQSEIRSSYDLLNSRVCFIHSEPEVEDVVSQQRGRGIFAHKTHALRFVNRFVWQEVLPDAADESRFFTSETFDVQMILQLTFPRLFNRHI